MYSFSIVTVVYNAKEQLALTIESVKHQTYKNYEHIIIDGFSSDGTIEYLKILNLDYLKFISEKDNGIYDAMNKGIDLAIGDYILFLNAGDIFASDDILNRVADSIESTKNVPKIVYGGANVYNESGSFITSLKPLNLTKVKLNMFATRTVCHQSIFVNKNSIKKYNTKYRLKGELNWYYDLVGSLQKGHILKLDIIVCNYYLGGTGDKNFIENYLERIAVIKKHNNIITFLFLFPFFLIPLLFRLKRKLSGN